MAIISADVPQIISYQGKLTDSKSGVAMNGAYDITFRMYSSEDDISALWSETHRDVPVKNGLFSVMLGTISPFAPALDFSQQYYLEVEVDGNVLTPRFQLGASPYALGIPGFGARDGQVLKWNEEAGRWLPADADIHCRTISPLSVDQVGSMTSSIVFANSSADGQWLGLGSSAGKIQFYDDPAIDRINLLNAKVGIGTSMPYYRLDLRYTGTFLGFRSYRTDNKDARITVQDNTEGWSIASGWWTTGDFSIIEEGEVGDRLYIKNNTGHVGLGTVSPEFQLDVSDDGGIIARGTYGSGDALTTSGAGTRMFWYPKKAAFRAGYVNGTQWNDANIGDYSVAMGSSAKASGEASVAMGWGAQATASYATACGGNGNDAQTEKSFIGGGQLNITGGHASGILAGYSNGASGDYSGVVAGVDNAANAHNSFATNYNSIVDHNNSAAFNSMTTTLSDQVRCFNLSATGTKSFTIDHPLDPLNKTLNHFCIESPEMMNMYRGETIIEEDSLAEIILPDYFETLNRNPMIQLTGVGTSNVFIADTVVGNRFVIGGEPGTKVYWQVTAERNDQNAQIARILIPVEQEKTGHLVGHSLNDDALAVTLDKLIELGYGDLFDFITDSGRTKYEQYHIILEESADTTE